MLLHHCKAARPARGGCALAASKGAIVAAQNDTCGFPPDDSQVVGLMGFARLLPLGALIASSVSPLPFRERPSRCSRQNQADRLVKSAVAGAARLLRVSRYWTCEAAAYDITTAVNLQQLRRLDDLDVAPEVAGIAPRSRRIGHRATVPMSAPCPRAARPVPAPFRTHVDRGGDQGASF